MRIKITSVRYIDGYKLMLKLSNGTEVERDLSRAVKRAKGIVRTIADPVTFKKVHVRRGTIEWPGEIDFCPDMLIWGRNRSMFRSLKRPERFLVI